MIQLILWAALHSVTLSWIAPTGGVPVVGYRVYRAPTCASPFVTYRSTPLLKVVDNTVVSGKKYAYQVTAMGNNGNESQPSNCVEVAIP